MLWNPQMTGAVSSPAQMPQYLGQGQSFGAVNSGPMTPGNWTPQDYANAKPMDKGWNMPDSFAGAFPSYAQGLTGTTLPAKLAAAKMGNGLQMQGVTPPGGALSDGAQSFLQQVQQGKGVGASMGQVPMGGMQRLVQQYQGQGPGISNWHGQPTANRMFPNYAASLPNQRPGGWPGYQLPTMGNQPNPLVTGNQPINPVGDVLAPNNPANPAAPQAPAGPSMQDMERMAWMQAHAGGGAGGIPWDPQTSNQMGKMGGNQWGARSWDNVKGLDDNEWKARQNQIQYYNMLDQGGG